MPKDPICGMDVSEDTQYKTQFKEKTYYFCSIVCKNVFEKEPHRYSSEREEGA